MTGLVVATIGGVRWWVLCWSDPTEAALSQTSWVDTRFKGIPPDKNSMLAAT